MVVSLMNNCVIIKILIFINIIITLSIIPACALYFLVAFFFGEPVKGYSELIIACIAPLLLCGISLIFLIISLKYYKYSLAITSSLIIFPAIAYTSYPFFGILLDLILR
jgi:hypothetical protein